MDILAAQTRGAEAVYKPQFPWNNDGPHRLWSLADMLKAFQISDFDKLLSDLRKLETELDEQVPQFGPTDKLHPYGEPFVLETRQVIDVALLLLKSMELEELTKRAMKISRLIDNPKGTVGELYRRIADLRESIEEALKGKIFLYVTPLKLDYFEQDFLFGEEVSGHFYAARLDIRDAGNCYAFELYTACVFHLMRVLEYGLKALAIDLGVPLKPIDCWGDILRELEEKMAEPDPSPRTAEKEERKRFRAEAAAQFRHFKNAWRNYTMHVWEYYHEKDATQVMEHVRDFMRHLATRLSYPRN